MRWQGQELGVEDADALPGMERLDGLVRSVTTPEFAGITFHEVMSKTALNRVPGASSMPFDWTVNPYRGCSHACTYCLSPRTRILLADGRQRPIGDLRRGDQVMGTRRGDTYLHYTATTVDAVWRTRKRAYRVTLADGTELIASGDHRFLTERGWKHVTPAPGAEQRPSLTTSNRLLGFGNGSSTIEASLDDQRYRRGYLAGMIRGDGMIFHRSYTDARRTRSIHRFRFALADFEALDRTREFLASEGIATNERPFSAARPERRAVHAIHTATESGVAAIERVISTPETPSAQWLAGFLGGIFDAEGSCSQGILRISNKSEEILCLIERALDVHRLPFIREPIRPSGVTTIRLLGGLPSRQRYFIVSAPAITRKLDLVGAAVKTAADLRVVSVEDLRMDIEMVDITTGTGDFIAEGVISHNCFARGSHTYLDLDGGKDFDSQIVVKLNVADVLQKEVRRGSWRHEAVALGTNTDPYQRAEGRYRLMPGIVSALATSGTPFSILTKGTLLRRDLPLLRDAAASVPVSLALSIAVFDDDLQQTIEPGTPSTAARLDTVRAAADAGFSVGVFLMPILPHLTDSLERIDDALRRIRDAGADRVIFGALHLRAGVKPWFFSWLEREHPELVSSYRRLYPGAASMAPKEYRRWLTARVRPLLRVYGLDRGDRIRTPAAASPVKPSAPAPPRLF